MISKRRLWYSKMRLG